MELKKSLQTVQWKDLSAPNRWHTSLEIFRPTILCAGAVATLSLLPGQNWWAMILLFFGHIAALRAAHGAVHGTLGLSTKADQQVLYAVSAALATSCHALEFTHKLHHKRCAKAEDVEGRIAHLGFWRACLSSPSYHWQVIRAAWRMGDLTRRKSIAIDLGLAAVLHATLFLCIGEPMYWLWSAIAILNGTSGLLSVWIFHRGGEVTRSGHWAMANWLAMGMLYHGEHHLYPGVPTAKLGELAARLKASKLEPEPLFDFQAKGYSSTSSAST